MKQTLCMAGALLFALCFPAADALAHPAWGIVVDGHRQIYFSDLENIWKIDASGRLTKFRAGVSGKHTHDLMLGWDGNLYGEDLSYEPATGRYTSSIWRMTLAGEFAYILGPTMEPPKGASIWRDRAGNMYSALWKSNQEHELVILKRSPEGKLTTLFGDAETAGKLRQEVLYSIGGMSFGPDGSLYLTDGPSVRKISATGAVTTILDHLSAEKPSDNPMGSGGEGRLLGLAVDGQGNIFAADYSNRRVLKIGPDGKSATALQTEAPWSPAGVAVTGDALYTLEVGFMPPRTYIGPRVRRLSSDGKAKVLAVVGETQTATGNEGSGEGDAASAAVQAQGISGRARRLRETLIIATVCIFMLALVVWLVKRRSRSLKSEV